MLRLPSAAMARAGVPMLPALSEDCCYRVASTAEGSFAGASPSSGSSTGSAAPVEGAGAYVFEEKVLGRGGYATVRLARPIAGGPCCAVKVLRKDCPSARSLAEREVAAMRLLEHEGVCELFDAFEDEGSLCLVLEYIDGHELFEEVAADELMDEGRAAEVMRQLLAALQHCHDRGVVHRDLKPENVMVVNRHGGEGLQVKLVDFGLATREGRQLRGVAGTRPYLAPEAQAGKGVCAASLDMWSAGVILYVCLVGELPPSSVCSGALPVLYAEAWRHVHASAAAKDLVARLMRPKACERLTAAEAARHPWLQGPRAQAPSVPSALACAELLAEKGLFGLQRQAFKAPAGKELPAEQFLAAVLPTEPADALLGCAEAARGVLDACGTGAAAAGEWLAWLGAAAAEEAAPAPVAPEPALGFALLDGCCGAQAEESVEAISSVAAASRAP